MLKSSRRVTVSSRLTAGMNECIRLFSSRQHRRFFARRKGENAPAARLLPRRRKAVDDLVERCGVSELEEKRESVGPAQLETESEDGEDDEDLGRVESGERLRRVTSEYEREEGERRRRTIHQTTLATIE